MKKIATIAAVLLSATPAAAQLSGDAFTWEAEACSNTGGVERSTVIAARKVEGRRLECDDGMLGQAQGRP